MHPKDIFFLVSSMFLASTILLLSHTEDVLAESESFTVAAREYEQIPIDLYEGDEMKFSIFVAGGTNDDIKLTIFMPDGEKPNAYIYEEHTETFTAPVSGTYVFSFSNTFSLISNKSVVFSYEITKNTYFIYIDELPDWADYAGNVMYDATEFWKRVYPKLNFYVAKTPQEADFTVKWVKDFGQEHIGYAFGQAFIEVGLGDSNCLGEWNPYSSNHVANIMKHEIGHVLGLGHSDDPSDIMYYSISSEYGLIEQEFILKPNSMLFVPVCAAKELTSFTYRVTTDDKDGSFNVFFVPSKNESDSWLEYQELSHYDNDGCFGIEYISYGGTCDGVSKKSGLMILSDDRVNVPLDINVKMQETQLSSYIRKETSLAVYKYASTLTGQPLTQLPENAEKPQGVIAQSGCGPGTVLKNGQCVLESASEKGGGCLIATAAYGSEMAPQVQFLREIRDDYVLSTRSGASFMAVFNAFYYSFSPTVADWERQNLMFKEMVKVTITPLLSSLSLLQYADVDTEEEMVGYGIGIILLNVGMYFVAPALIIFKIKSKFRNPN